MVLKQGDLNQGCVNQPIYFKNCSYSCSYKRSWMSSREAYYSSGCFLCSFKSSRDGDIIIGKYLFNNSARTHKVKIFLSYWQWCLFCRNITTLSDTWLYWGWCSPHHQHGVSEHTIQTISWWDILRCCRHFLHWPAQTDLKLWPFALLCSRVSKKTQNL